MLTTINSHQQSVSCTVAHTTSWWSISRNTYDQLLNKLIKYNFQISLLTLELATKQTLWLCAFDRQPARLVGWWKCSIIIHFVRIWQNCHLLSSPDEVCIFMPSSPVSGRCLTMFIIIAIFVIIRIADTEVELSVSGRRPTMFIIIIVIIIIIIIIIARVADTGVELSVSGRRPTMFWSKYWGSGVPGPRHHYSRDR